MQSPLTEMARERDNSFPRSTWILYSKTLVWRRVILLKVWQRCSINTLILYPTTLVWRGVTLLNVRQRCHRHTWVLYPTTLVGRRVTFLNVWLWSLFVRMQYTWYSIPYTLGGWQRPPPRATGFIVSTYRRQGWMLSGEHMSSCTLPQHPAQRQNHRLYCFPSINLPPAGPCRPTSPVRTLPIPNAPSSSL